MDEFYNSHYITVDEQNRIVDGWSDGPHPEKDTTDAVCINERGGYQFRLYPNGEENPCLYDWDGMIPLYAYIDGEVIKRTEEEIEADRAAIVIPDPAPTTEERVTALEEQLAETDEVAILLYEASLEQEAVNSEQDEAIIEIYEMMEEMSNG